ncbi:hypothetical protein H4V98_003156 [Polaromonas sp. CG_23.6]|nr:hypothetical protein [Polaromonas sp. CG_23.6]
MIDSTIVRARQHSAGAKKRCLSNARRWGADVLLMGTPGATVIADKAYDAQERVIEPLPMDGAPA